MKREAQRTCKPGSVSLSSFDRLRMSDNLGISGTVTIYLASRRASGPALRQAQSGTALPPWSSSQPGDEPGAHSPSIRPCSRWGLTAAASPQSAGRSYRPISPLPRARTSREAVCFCATFRLPRRTDPLRQPGRYPAPCPEEPGLSSPKTRLGLQGGHPVRIALLSQSSIGHIGGQTAIGQPYGRIQRTEMPRAAWLFRQKKGTAQAAPFRLPDIRPPAIPRRASGRNCCS